MLTGKRSCVEFKKARLHSTLPSLGWLMYETLSQPCPAYIVLNIVRRVEFGCLLVTTWYNNLFWRHLSVKNTRSRLSENQVLHQLRRYLSSCRKIQRKVSIGPNH